MHTSEYDLTDFPFRTVETFGNGDYVQLGNGHLHAGKCGRIDEQASSRAYYVVLDNGPRTLAGATCLTLIKSNKSGSV